jgi:hypothetical protein
MEAESKHEYMSVEAKHEDRNIQSGWEEISMLEIKKWFDAHKKEHDDLMGVSLKICGKFPGFYPLRNRAMFLSMALFCFSYVLEVEDPLTRSQRDINLLSFMYTSVEDGVNEADNEVNAVHILFKLLYNAMLKEPRVVCFYPTRPMDAAPLSSVDKSKLQQLMVQIHQNGKLFNYMKPYLANHPLFRATRKLADVPLVKR